MTAPNEQWQKSTLEADPDYLHDHPDQDPRRLGKATASEFHNILAKGRYGKEAAGRRNYRIQLALERVTGKTPTRFSNAYTDWGHDTEELAVVELMLRMPELDIDKCGFIEHAFLAAGASPDRLIAEDGVVEVKCFNSANHYEALRTNKLPSEYVAQVQGQLWITGRKYAIVVMYDPDFPPNSQLIILRVERDEKYIDDLMVEVSNFLDEVDEQVKFINNYKET
jgi:predicted phage-related endonuclease